MKVRLTRPNKIEKGRAGDIVEVEPARARFLFSLKMAEPAQIREQIEAPAKTAKTKLVEPGPAKITKPAATEKAATGKTTAKAAKAAKGKK